jgi:hypothetical protein
LTQVWAARQKGIDRSWMTLAAMIGDFEGLGARLPTEVCFELPSMPAALGPGGPSTLGRDRVRSGDRGGRDRRPDGRGGEGVCATSETRLPYLSAPRPGGRPNRGSPPPGGRKGRS